MKDFLGNELSVGDKVITIIPNYRGLVLATVIKFTPKKVRVSYKNTWNYRDGYYTELIQDPCQLVKM